MDSCSAQHKAKQSKAFRIGSLFSFIINTKQNDTTMIVRSLNLFFLLLLLFQVTNARNNYPNTKNSRALKIRPGVYAFSLIHQDQVLFRRRRNMQEKEESKLPQAAELYQGYGTHYVDLWLGLPNPQRQTVIVSFFSLQDIYYVL